MFGFWTVCCTKEAHLKTLLWALGKFGFGLFIGFVENNRTRQLAVL